MDSRGRGAPTPPLVVSSYSQLALYTTGNALAFLLALLVWNLNRVLADYRDAAIYALLCSLALRGPKDSLVAFLDRQLDERTVAGAALATIFAPLAFLKEAWDEVTVVAKRWQAALLEQNRQFRRAALEAIERAERAELLASAAVGAGGRPTSRTGSVGRLARNASALALGAGRRGGGVGDLDPSGSDAEGDSAAAPTEGGADVTPRGGDGDAKAGAEGSGPAADAAFRSRAPVVSSHDGPGAPAAAPQDGHRAAPGPARAGPGLAQPPSPEGGGPASSVPPEAPRAQPPPPARPPRASTPPPSVARTATPRTVATLLMAASAGVQALQGRRTESKRGRRKGSRKESDEGSAGGGGALSEPSTAHAGAVAEGDPGAPAAPGRPASSGEASRPRTANGGGWGAARSETGAAGPGDLLGVAAAVAAAANPPPAHSRTPSDRLAPSPRLASGNPAGGSVRPASSTPRASSEDGRGRAAGADAPRGTPHPLRAPSPTPSSSSAGFLSVESTPQGRRPTPPGAASRMMTWLVRLCVARVVYERTRGGWSRTARLALLLGSLAATLAAFLALLVAARRTVAYAAAAAATQASPGPRRRPYLGKRRHGVESGEGAGTGHTEAGAWVEAAGAQAPAAAAPSGRGLRRRASRRRERGRGGGRVATLDDDGAPEAAPAAMAGIGDSRGPGAIGHFARTGSTALATLRRALDPAHPLVPPRLRAGIGTALRRALGAAASAASRVDLAARGVLRANLHALVSLVLLLALLLGSAAAGGFLALQIAGEARGVAALARDAFPAAWAGISARAPFLVGDAGADANAVAAGLGAPRARGGGPSDTARARRSSAAGADVPWADDEAGERARVYKRLLEGLPGTPPSLAARLARRRAPGPVGDEPEARTGDDGPAAAGVGARTAGSADDLSEEAGGRGEAGAPGEGAESSCDAGDGGADAGAPDPGTWPRDPAEPRRSEPESAPAEPDGEGNPAPPGPLDGWLERGRGAAAALAARTLPAAASFLDSWFREAVEARNLTAVVDDLRLLAETAWGPRECSPADRGGLLADLARAQLAASETRAKADASAADEASAEEELGQALELYSAAVAAGGGGGAGAAAGVGASGPSDGAAAATVPGQAPVPASAAAIPPGPPHAGGPGVSPTLPDGPGAAGAPARLDARDAALTLADRVARASEAAKEARVASAADVEEAEQAARAERIARDRLGLCVDALPSERLGGIPATAASEAASAAAGALVTLPPGSADDATGRLLGSARAGSRGDEAEEAGGGEDPRRGEDGSNGDDRSGGPGPASGPPGQSAPADAVLAAIQGLESVRGALWRGSPGDALSELSGLATSLAGSLAGDLPALGRLGASALEPLAQAARLGLLSLAASVAGAATGTLGVLRLGASLVNLILQGALFLALLYYLLVAERDPLRTLADVLPLPRAARARAGAALSDALQGVFVASVRLVAFHFLFAWLSFRVLHVPLAYSASAVASLCALVPFVPTYSVALPGALYLVAVGSPAYGALLALLHFLAYFFGDSLILEDIPGGHPYLLSLGILGGMWAFASPLQGVILGPSLLTLAVVSYRLHADLLGTSGEREPGPAAREGGGRARPSGGDSPRAHGTSPGAEPPRRLGSAGVPLPLGEGGGSGSGCWYGGPPTAPAWAAWPSGEGVPPAPAPATYPAAFGSPLPGPLGDGAGAPCRDAVLAYSPAFSPAFPHDFARAFPPASLSPSSVPSQAPLTSPSPAFPLAFSLGSSAGMTPLGAAPASGLARFNPGGWGPSATPPTVGSLAGPDGASAGFSRGQTTPRGFGRRRLSMPSSDEEGGEKGR